MFSDHDLERADYVNRIIFGQEIIQRKEDMSPDGTLTLCCDQDGDIGIQVFSPENNKLASIEFCTTGLGGGRSPRTHKALRELFVAMVEDQADQPLDVIAGRFPVEGKIKVKS